MTVKHVKCHFSVVQSGRQQRRSAFTVVELLVVMLVIAALISLLFPALQSVMQSSRSTKCSSRMRQIGIAAMQYAHPRGGRLPRVTGHGDEIDESWIYDLGPYLGNVDDMRICPEDPDGDVRREENLTSYVLNGYLAKIEEVDPDHDDDHDEHDEDHDDEHEHDHEHDHDEHDHEHMDGRFANITRLKSPSKTIMLFEAADGAHIDHVDSFEWFVDEHTSDDSVYDVVSSEVAVERHNGTANYLYVDGHVETHGAEIIQDWCLEGTEDLNFALPAR